MDSTSALVDACVNLPPLVEAINSTCLQHPADIVRFRSVCRSWRISTPLPLYKISLLFPRPFPLTPPFLQNPSPLVVHASAVYLLRPDPNSKPLIVSVQETYSGNLILRHALTYQEIKILHPPPRDGTYTTTTTTTTQYIPRKGQDGTYNNNNSNKWMATQITRAFAYNSLCRSCNGAEGTNKVAFVSSSERQTGEELVGLCESNHALFPHELWALKLGGLGGVARRNARAIRLDKHVNYRFRNARAIRLDKHVNYRITDVVNFNGRIFAVDNAGHIYVFDLKEFKTLRIGYLPLQGGYALTNNGSSSHNRLRFVVSDGDLYVVLRFREPFPTCLVYRVVVAYDDINVEMPAERVRDLGDRVFFVAKNCSFSVSARDLPHPWRENCIVVVDDYFSSCGCHSKYGKINVWNLGANWRPRFKPMWSLQGFSDLFAPPSSFNFNQVSLQFPRDQY